MYLEFWVSDKIFGQSDYLSFVPVKTRRPIGCDMARLVIGWTGSTWIFARCQASNRLPR